MQTSLVFFCYARTEQTFALNLYSQLRNAGVNVWIDQIDIEAGREWDSEVEKALKRCSCLLFLASEASINSKNVLDEVNYALNKDKKVVPLFVEKCEIPYRLQRLQYIDFTIDFDTALNQLIETFKAEGKEETPSQISSKVTENDTGISDTDKRGNQVKVIQPGSFQGATKKPLVVCLVAAIILGIALLIGNVQQIVHFLSSDKKSVSQIDKPTNQHGNQLNIGIPQNNDSLQITNTKERTDSIQAEGLDKSFESPPAHIIKGKHSENNPNLGVASIKIQDSIAWSETVFSKEEKKQNHSTKEANQIFRRINDVSNV